MGTPHIAITDDGAEFVVKGDRVSFVTPSQVALVGSHPLDPVKMPSDAVLPNDFVMLHDPSGKYLRRCDFYVLPVRKGASVSVQKVSRATRDVALNFYGSETPLRVGVVDLPKGSWHRVAQIAFIRYRRQGNRRGNFEHPYELPVVLYDNPHPAWRFPLPNGCVVDAHGFVWP